MLRHIFLALLCVMAVAACGNSNKEAEAAGSTAGTTAGAAKLVAPEDLVTLHNNSLASEPVITGSIEPERRADLRAEVSSVVLQVLKENGERVKKGDLLVRLDDAPVRDSLTTAEEAVRALGQARDQSERQFQRLKRLVGEGLASIAEREDTEIRYHNAQSDFVAAEGRATQARQQLQRTLVRAPFDGTVNDRKISPGDTVQVGKELIKVIDPTSIRFEGLVSADEVGKIKIGQAVNFWVNGQSQLHFVGKVKHIDSAANATTRQISVLVDFADGTQPRMSGLYAEGRIKADSMQTLMIPEAALVRSGDKAYAWRLKDGVLNKIGVAVGERDQRSGAYVVRSGLATGDMLVRNPNAALKEGQKVEAPVAKVAPASVPSVSLTSETTPAGV